MAQAKPRGRRIVDDDERSDDRDDAKYHSGRDSRPAPAPASTAVTAMPAGIVIANPPSLLQPIVAILRLLVWLTAFVYVVYVKMGDFRATQNIQLIEYLYRIVFSFCVAFCVDRALAMFGSMSEGFRFWTWARRLRK
jgi:hypothetical protein